MSLIIIAGSYRSGSTWLYNAARLLVKASGHSVEGIGPQKYKGKPDDGVLIVKCHRFYGRIAHDADYVLTSERDWTEAKKSWFRFKGEWLSEEQEAARKLWLHTWRVCPAHVFHMQYQDMIDKPYATLAGVACGLSRLMRGVDLRGVLDDLEAIKPPKSGYDPVTMMYHNHRTV